MAGRPYGATDGEKGEVTYSDQSPTEYSSPIEEDEGTPAEHKRIRLKVDLRLVVLIGFMYCVSLMDRSNLANANTAGMGCPRIEADSPIAKKLPEKSKYCIGAQGLDLKGFRYNIMTLVFFPPYIIFQIPSTVIVRALGPRIHLSALTLLWGSVMIGMAFVDDWKTMSGTRVILGVLEAGFFPSCVYLVSTWYTRYEMGKRYSLFYILGCVASAFSGLFAYALMDLQGKLNLSAWRWIFLVEGLLTCVVAFIGFALLIGFPDHWSPRWHFLSEKEVKLVLHKVNKDRGDAIPEPFKMGLYLRGALDWTIWAYALLFFNTTTIAYALAYFLPEILKETLHYTPKDSQIMTAPPYVFGGVIMWGAGYVGDKYRIRGPIVIFNMLLCIIGLPLLRWTDNGKLRYFSLFLVAAGCNANIPTVMTYQANNIRGQWKRALCSATLVGFGGIGGIAGSLIFRTQDKPHYTFGIAACLLCSCTNVLIVCLLSLKFTRDNKRADRGEIRIAGGDEHFRWTI